MDKLPVYFASPNPDLFQHLKEQMRNLPIVTLKAAQKELTRFYDLEQLSVLNGHDTIEHMRKELLHDYQTQVNEIDEVP